MRNSASIIILYKIYINIFNCFVWVQCILYNYEHACAFEGREEEEDEANIQYVQIHTVSKLKADEENIVTMSGPASVRPARPA